VPAEPLPDDTNVENALAGEAATRAPEEKPFESALPAEDEAEPRRAVDNPHEELDDDEQDEELEDDADLDDDADTER
jgi:hypothetical protein